MTVTRIQEVIGMTCDHCVRAVTEELEEIPGVVGVAVELGDGPISTVTITSTQQLLATDIATAVEEAGYQVPQDRPGQDS